MNWLEAAEAAPSIEAKDIGHLALSVEEADKLITLYTRSLANARSDSSDIAMIALKKALSEYPAWGEAALLYGICLALDGKLKRAKASFDHALSVGLVAEQTTYLAQMCYQLAVSQTENPAEQISQEESTPLSKLLGGKISARKKKSIFEEPDAEDKGRMRSPILARAPRSAGKAKMASDRERRDVLMQANSANPDSPDEEIDVSIPRTPAEKLRIVLSLLGIILVSALLGLFVWYVAIPGVNQFMESREDSLKLEYLKSELEKYQDDPEIKGILDAYASSYPDHKAAAQPAPSVSGSDTTGVVPTTAADSSPEQETTIPTTVDETTSDLAITQSSEETTTPASDTTSMDTESTNSAET